MADNTQAPPSTAPAKGGPPANPPPMPTLEPEMDALLNDIPDFKGLFAESESSGKNKTPESKEPTPEAEEATTEGLDAAVPIEDETETETAVAEPEPEVEPEPEEKPDAVQKRIDKLTAQRKTAEEKAAELELELTALKEKIVAGQPIAPTPTAPLSHIEDMAGLQKQLELSRRAKSWAIENLNGGEVDLGNGETKFLDDTQVRTLLSRAEAMLEQHIPQRGQFLQAKADFDNQARKSYPNLFKPGSNEQIEYNTWRQALPQAWNFPDISLIVGDAIVGRQIRLQKAAQKGKATNGNGNNPLAAPAPSAQPRVPAKRALSGEALTAIASDPQGGALDQFVAQLIESHGSQRKKS